MFFFWENIFKRLHITDIGLIWFWLQSQISWKQYRQWQWEIFYGGSIFPIVHCICLGIYFFIYRYHIYNSIHSSNDTIQKSESHWTFMIEFSKETDMENNLWAGWYRDTNRRQRRWPITWLIQPRLDEDPAATVIQGVLLTVFP